MDGAPVGGRARRKARLHLDSTQVEAEVGKREAPAKVAGSIGDERLEWNRRRRIKLGWPINFKTSAEY